MYPAKVLTFYDLLPDVDYLHATNVSMLCPFHEEKHRSFSFNLQTGAFNCFSGSCGTRGRSVETFIRLYEDHIGNPNTPTPCDELHAMLLAAKINVLVPDDFMFNVAVPSPLSDLSAAEKREFAFDFFESLLRPKWQDISHYLLERGYVPSTLDAFDARINPHSTYPIVLPIYEQGVFKGYTQRHIDDREPKYLFNDGFQKAQTLDGNLTQGPVMVVEGKLDQMMAWQYGFTNVCCTFGWHCSDIQFTKIMQYATRIISAYDNDESGRKGLARLKRLANGTTQVTHFSIDRAKDPSAMTESEFLRSMYLADL